MSCKLRAICVSSSARGRGPGSGALLLVRDILLGLSIVGHWSCGGLWTPLCSILSLPLPPVPLLRFLVPFVIYRLYYLALRLYQVFIIVYKCWFEEVLDCDNNRWSSQSLHRVRTVGNFRLPTAKSFVTATADYNGTRLKTVRLIPSSSTSSLSNLYPPRRGR